MTSGNGNNAPTVTGSTPQDGERKPPQAIVKPQILTHLIEGFVIQEGADPFPVERPSFLIESLKKHQHSHSEKQSSSPRSNTTDSEKQSSSPRSNTTDSEMDDLSRKDLEQQQSEPMLTCELCGRVDFAYIFKRSKRFCSNVCAKRYNVGCTKRVGLFPNRKTTLENLKKQRAANGNIHNSNLDSKKKAGQKQLCGGSMSSGRSTHPAQGGESSQCSDMSSYDSPPSPLSAASSAQGVGGHGFLPGDPVRWNVGDVYEFICSLPGCLEIAEEFRSQEIDGQALLLLKEDHLMGTMNIKLGPALKIFAQISVLKDS